MYVVVVVLVLESGDVFEVIVVAAALLAGFVNTRPSCPL